MSEKKLPLVSVILPTCNRPNFLVEALNSILNQTYENIEIIVVNDGGCDIADIIDAHKATGKIRYLKLAERKGPAAARNTALRIAKGKYIAYLDDDDVYYPQHLETLVGFLERNGCKVAYSDSYQALQVPDGNGYKTIEKRPVYRESFDRQRLLVMNYIPTLNIVHRRECLEEAGLFDEGLETHEDWDLWIRMSRKNDFQHIESITAEFRTRMDSGNNTLLKRLDFLRTMKIIHSRYSHLATNPDIIKQKKYVENELKKEISLLEKGHIRKPDDLLIVTSKKGLSSLKVRGDDGCLRALHSLYDPEAEAKTIVDAFKFDGKGILVVLGLGLGYHVVEVSRRFPGAEIIVVEADPEIHRLALEHGPALGERVRVIAGLDKDEVIREITRQQVKHGMVPLSVFSLSSAVSAFRDYYGPILGSLQKTVSIRLWDRLKYPKFKEDALKIVLIESGYFLIREVEKALKSLGHKVVRIPVPSRDNPAPPLNKGGDDNAMISRFVETILNFKPDFLLTINHLGFDEDGVLTAFFKSIEMPVASWYVDSPNLIVRAFEKNVSPFISLFLWDRSYIDDMGLMGFESVSYLPLGTDESIFKPMTSRKHRKKLNKYLCDIGFVGNSMVKPVDEWMSKVSSDIHPLVEKLAEDLAKSDALNVSAMDGLSDHERALIDGLDEKQKMDFEAAVLWKATLLYRLSCIKMLGGFDVRIHGDREWTTLFKNDKNIRLHPPLNYYRDLPLLYNACKINFNATSLQMGQAVNQRVFDVPSCAAFLLTDYRKGIDELFEVGKEVVTYKHREEIPDIVNYYLRHPEKRRAVAAKGRERVLKEHTYRHRIENLIELMAKRYK